MSPTPAKTSHAAIIAAGRSLLEDQGLERVTMATVAARVGVRPPSLYKHVRDRSALIAALVTDATDELGTVLRAAAAAADDAPAVRLAALAEAFRAFASRSPRAAALLFADLGAGAEPPIEALARAAEPVVEVSAALAGPDAALPAARVITAFAYGFTSMEAAGAFHLGGNVDDAFRLGIATLVRGLERG